LPVRRRCSPIFLSFPGRRESLLREPELRDDIGWEDLGGDGGEGKEFGFL
jgi:hypothetical protein